MCESAACSQFWPRPAAPNLLSSPLPSRTPEGREPEPRAEVNLLSLAPDLRPPCAQRSELSAPFGPRVGELHEAWVAARRHPPARPARDEELFPERLERGECKAAEGLLVVGREAPVLARRLARAQVVDHLAVVVELVRLGRGLHCLQHLHRHVAALRLRPLWVELAVLVEVHQLVPVDALEEGVRQDRLDALVGAPEALRRVAHQEGAHDVVRLGREPAGRLDGFVLGEVLALFAVRAAERVLAGEHLEDEQAEVPPVGALAVRSHVHLGRAVAVRAGDGHAQGARHVLLHAGVRGDVVLLEVRLQLLERHGGLQLGRAQRLMPVLLREAVDLHLAARALTARRAHVGEFAVAVGVEEDVVGLHVAVEDAHLVHLRDGEHHLRRVHARAVEGVGAVRDHIGVHVAALFEVADEQQQVLRLQRVLERHDERVRHVRERGLLAEDREDLLARDQDALVHHLHCVQPLRRLAPHEQHHAEAARAEKLDHVEVLGREDRREVAVGREELFVA
mmetsp:Transcript_12381/g.31319  ORF Transcript_12381/g.31319 Transcript_12381/m.31319 type:complete len:509 (+) Transcript_12381:117-1643(+)